MAPLKANLKRLWSLELGSWSFRRLRQTIHQVIFLAYSGFKSALALTVAIISSQWRRRNGGSFKLSST